MLMFSSNTYIPEFADFTNAIFVWKKNESFTSNGSFYLIFSGYVLLYYFNLKVLKNIVFLYFLYLIYYYKILYILSVIDFKTVL